jgi:hypothetical protein
LALLISPPLPFVPWVANMTKDETVNAIPISSSSDAGTRTYFKNIIDAIAQIQQFAVMERSDYEIPQDFLTIRGELNFFSIGFGNGFIEGMVFALLLAIIMPIMHSDYLMESVAAAISPGPIPHLPLDIEPLAHYHRSGALLLSEPLPDRQNNQTCR